MTPERLKQLLSYDEETGHFVWLLNRCGPKARVGAVAGCENGQGYIRIYLDGKPYKAHRLAWLYVHGNWPEGEIDHINRVRSDNRIANLREATRAQNRTNCDAYKNNSSGVKGVSFSARARKWTAQIQVKGVKRGLGYFDTKEAAAEVYARAAVQSFGEFARVP